MFICYSPEGFCLFLKTKPQRASCVSSCRHPWGWVDLDAAVLASSSSLGLMLLAMAWEGDEPRTQMDGHKNSCAASAGWLWCLLPSCSCPGPSQLFAPLCGSADAAGSDPRGAT